MKNKVIINDQKIYVSVEFLSDVLKLAADGVEDILERKAPDDKASEVVKSFKYLESFIRQMEPGDYEDEDGLFDATDTLKEQVFNRFPDVDLMNEIQKRNRIKKS